MTKQKRRQVNPPRARRRGSFRKYTLYYVIALLLLVSVGAALSLTVFFHIASVKVAGNTVYANTELVEASGIKAGDNLLRLPTKKVEAALLEKYPYLETVSVRRTLPDSVTIRVTIAKGEAALRGADGRYLLASRAGRVLESGLALCPEGKLPADGFETQGLLPGDALPETEQERLATLLELQDVLYEKGLADDIRVIDVSDLLNLRLLYDGRLAILLGSSLELSYKVEFAKTTIASAVTETTVGTLDVSARPAARLREYDIYTEENWPFAAELRAEYERRIVKEQPWLALEQPQEAPAAQDETSPVPVEPQPEAGSPAPEAEPEPPPPEDGEEWEPEEQSEGDG